MDALARGWDFQAIEDTAKKGVAEEDVRALAGSVLTPDALLAWCRERVAADRQASHEEDAC